jgi:hypothetical protein
MKFLGPARTKAEPIDLAARPDTLTTLKDATPKSGIGRDRIGLRVMMPQ